MLVDRDAAPVVGDGQAVAFLQRHLDAAGVAGDGLVHRVVEHFGGEVVQRTLVGPADIHPGPPPHRLQPLKHFDCGTVVSLGAGGGQFVEQVIGHGQAYRVRANPGASRSRRLSPVARRDQS